MTLLQTVRFVHFVAAATWVGGVIVLAPLVVALRRAGADRELIRAAARAFARVGWVALAVAVVTGVAQVVILPLPLAYVPLQRKIAAVTVAAVAAGVHQVLAARVSERGRRALEVAVLATTLVVVAAAAGLRP